MTFCDRLTFFSFCALMRHGLRRSSPVIVLEGQSATGTRILRAVAEWCGANVEFVNFFAGDLRIDGEAAPTLARRTASRLSIRWARQIVRSSVALAEINRRYGRDTLTLHIAKAVCLDIERTLLRLMVASALSSADPRASELVVIIVRKPATFDSAILHGAVPGVSPVFYRFGSVLAKWSAIVRALLVAAGRQLVWRFAFLRTSSAPVPTNGEPAVLVTQEDDLSIDRSYRTQPHWWFPDDPPEFATYVFPKNVRRRMVPDVEALRRERIFPLDGRSLASVNGGDQLDRSLARHAQRCLFAAMLSSEPASVSAYLTIWTLLGRARVMAGIVRQFNISVFLSGEPYLIDVDAMHLVSRDLRVKTLTFQYSNILSSGPLMLTTADTMLVFSEMYRQLWDYEGMRPQRFVPVGYAFDSSFRLLTDRAAKLRSLLSAAGANFVIAYFDENVDRDERYGLISRDHHLSEIRQLAELVLDDPSAGVVIKSQFERNSPSRLYGGEELLARAAKTGRYVELSYGTHRNVVFPAEAALASDIAIGHSLGATAALEAALAGRRALVLNRYGVRGPYDDFYAQADVVCGSMADALQKIERFRAADPLHAQLGDWSAIAEKFDPFRDGKSASRIRAAIQEALLTDQAFPTEDVSS